jgi:hypothetical protein
MNESCESRALLDRETLRALQQHQVPSFPFRLTLAQIKVTKYRQDPATGPLPRS